MLEDLLLVATGGFWSALGYILHGRKKPPAGYEVEGKGNAGNIQGGQNNTVHYHGPSREMTEMEKSLTETINLMAAQLSCKSKTIEQFRQTLANYQVEFLKQQLENTQLREQNERLRKKKKQGIKLPIFEMALSN